MQQSPGDVLPSITVSNSIHTPFPKTLSESFVRAQGNFRTPTLNRTAEVKKDGKLLYETYYADLQEIFDCVRAPLLEQGIGFHQTTELTDKGWVLILELVHHSGESKKTYMPINMNQRPQEVGGNLTYFKRYQASAFFGLAADFDDDGNASTGNEVNFGSRYGNPAMDAPKPKSEVKAPGPGYEDDIRTKPVPKPVDLKQKQLGQAVEKIIDQLDQRAPLDILLDTVKKRSIPYADMPGIIKRATMLDKKAAELTEAEIDKVLKYINLFGGRGSSSSENGTGVMTPGPASSSEVAP